MPDPDDVDLTVVVMVFTAADPEALLSVLAKYVVLARGHPGCRNIDLIASVTHPGRLLIIQKWSSPAAQQAHFDSADMVEMAEAVVACSPRPPTSTCSRRSAPTTWREPLLQWAASRSLTRGR